MSRKAWSLLTGGLAVAFLAGGAGAQVSGGPRVWVASATHGRVYVVDPDSGQIAQVLRDDRPRSRGELCFVGIGGYSDLAPGEGRVWAVAPGAGVCGLHPDLREPGFSVPGQLRTDRAAAGGGAVWLLQGSWATRVDPGSGTRTDSVHLGEERLAHVAVGGGRTWISAHSPWDLFVLPAGGGGPPDSLRLGSSGAALAAGEGSLWAYGPGEGDGMHVWRLGIPAGGVAARIPIPEAQGIHADPTIALGEGGVWVGTGEQGVVVRIDPGTNRVTGSLDAGEWVVGVAAGAGALWILTQGDELGHLLQADPRSLEVLARLPIPDGVAAVAVH